MPLDMDEESYSNVYCNIIRTMELLREGKLARKAMKKKNFDMSSAEAFAVSWDAFVNDTKGFRELTRLREKYMANRIKLLSKNSKHMLAVIETERVGGIVSLLREGRE
jgi:pheromone shutdown protein TraB